VGTSSLRHELVGTGVGLRVSRFAIVVVDDAAGRGGADGRAVVTREVEIRNLVVERRDEESGGQSLITSEPAVLQLPATCDQAIDVFPAKLLQIRLFGVAVEPLLVRLQYMPPAYRGDASGSESLKASVLCSMRLGSEYT
jgi:hypothetical protein